MPQATLNEPVTETAVSKEHVSRNIEHFLNGHTRNGAVGLQQNMVARPKPPKQSPGSPVRQPADAS